MARGHCFICGQQITAGTNSKEHLFQNAIGGRRKVSGFLHETCNNLSGDKWDHALAQQMNAFCLFLGIVRERGQSPRMRVKTTAGEDLALTAGGGLEIGEPFCKIIESPDGPAISLQARTSAEARAMLEEVKRDSYPKLDIDKILRTFKVETGYPQGAIRLSFSFGGREAGPAMVKTAAAFAHSVGVDTRACDLAAAYLRDQAVQAPFGYYDDKDLVLNRPAGLPMHVVAVSGDPATRMLLGYVEYFGVIRLIVGLSTNYTGPSIHRSYAVDPLTGQDLDVQVEKLVFTSADLQTIYSYERTSPEAQRCNFGPVFDAAIKRQFEREKNRAIAAAVDYAFKNCGAKYGGILTDEQTKRLGGLISHHMIPFFLRHMVRPPRPSPGLPPI